MGKLLCPYLTVNSDWLQATGESPKFLLSWWFRTTGCVAISCSFFRVVAEYNRNCTQDKPCSTLMTFKRSVTARLRGDFRIWTRFLRRYVYFRVIRFTLTPTVCMPTVWLRQICCTLTWELPPGILNDTRPHLVERWTIGYESCSLDWISKIAVVFSSGCLMSDHPSFSSQSMCFQVTASINL